MNIYTIAAVLVLNGQLLDHEAEEFCSILGPQVVPWSAAQAKAQIEGAIQQIRNGGAT